MRYFYNSVIRAYPCPLWPVSLDEFAGFGICWSPETVFESAR